MKKLLVLATPTAPGGALLSTSGALAPNPTATTRVSVSGSGGQGDHDTYAAGISADGRYVLLSSQARNLVPGDTNDRWDVFVHDRTTGATRRVSVASDGAQVGPTHNPCGGSTAGAISASGRYVVFQSDATNLVRGDTNRVEDVFLHDRRTGRTERVSVTSAGRQAGADRTNNGSNAPVISADGRYVAFHSADSNLVPHDTNRTFDIFVHDRKTGRTARVSVGGNGGHANGENLG